MVTANNNNNTKWQVFLRPRIIFTLLLGFSSGLPLALVGPTLQAWYTVAGIPILAIGALSLTGQPYVYKFLWAPLLDRFTPPILGRRRSWIMIFQICLVISLSIIACLNPKSYPVMLGFVALISAFFSASQDVAIDAYRTDLLHPDERGPGASVTVLGYRLAMLLSGGLALVLADSIGWRATYLLMAAILAVEILITLKAPEPDRQAHAPKRLQEAVVQPFREFLSRKSSVGILGLIFTYKLSNVFALALSSTFLLRSLGFSLTDVGTLYKTVGLAATLLGAVAGGIWLNRLGLYRSLLIFAILQATSNIAFVLLSITGKNYGLLVSTLFVESFCDGLSSVAMVSFAMSLCDPRYTATQYALFSALEAVPRVFVGPIAAVLVMYLGWSKFFMLAVLMGLPCILMLRFLKDRIHFATTSDPLLEKDS